MSSKLTREDLSTAVSTKTGILPVKAREVVGVILTTLSESLADGREVELRGFGSFDIKMAKARPGRNPNKPSHVVMIPERKIIKFKPGKIIRDAIKPITTTISGGPTVKESV